MTKHECAIVMAYTGVCMCAGENFRIFHEYVNDIMERPVWTHELGNRVVLDEIKKRAEPDFLNLCKTATD